MDRVVQDLSPGTFEHITFQQKDASLPPPASQLNRPADGSDANGDGGAGGTAGERAGAAAEGSEYNYLLEQRKLVEGIQMKPLPQHLITTYRPGYLHSHTQDDQTFEGNGTATAGTAANSGGNTSEGQQRDKLNEVEEAEKRINQDPTTKYLTFLPHSGFHNQRTELENALLLARLLNRTLIMPKVYLGPPMPWLTFHLLHSRLLYQTKIGLEHCRAIIESQVDFEDEEGENGGVESKGVGGREKQEQEYHREHHPQKPLPPQSIDTVVQKVPLPLPLPVPVQEPKKMTVEPAESAAELEIKDDTQAGGTVLSEELAATLDTQQGVPAINLADKDESVNPTPGGESIEQSTLETAEAEVEEAEEEMEEEMEEEDEGFQSWIEEPDEEDRDRVRIATGDGDLGNIMDLEDEQEVEEVEEEEGDEGFDHIKDWSQAVGDGEDDEVGNSDFETEQRRRRRRRRAGGYDYERDPTSLQMGILDDDEDDEGMDDRDDGFDWRPEYYTLRQQQKTQRYRDSLQKQRQRFRGGPGGRGRLLSQQMQMDIEGAALPLYLPAPERPIDQKAAGLRFKKRSMPIESPSLPLDATTAGAAVIEPRSAGTEKQKQKKSTDFSHLEKQQLAEQYAVQQQQQQQQHQAIPPEQHHDHRPPSSAATAAKKEKPSRSVQWAPLPAECLQYESWTMTDWDLFFDLDPLRRYVRILTRESMSMAYLESQFNIAFLHPEKSIAPAPSADTVPLKSPDKVSTEESKPSHADTDGESGGEKTEKNSEGDGPRQKTVNGGDTAQDTESDTGDDSEKLKPPLLRSEADVLFFDDTSLYDYRFSETPNATESQKTRTKFVQEFTIDWLAQRPERLIHLGSIFGTGRVAIESLEAKAWLQMIRDHLIIQTEILQTTSQSIADKISGRIEGDVGSAGDHGGGVGEFGDPMEAGFVGIHIRMSDGHFSLKARDTIENIRQELMWQIGMSDPTIAMSKTDPAVVGSSSSGTPPPPPKNQGRLSIEQCRTRAINHHRALKGQLLQQQQDRKRKRELGHPPMKPPPSSNQQPQQHEQQQPLMQVPTSDDPSTPKPKRRSNGRYTPIYLATDAHQPRSNPIFDRLFSTFDCIFTLDDFAEDLEPLTQYRNPEDGTLMTRFLIPMVDAMVVAKAAAFFGTPASTFSNYIQRQLRPAYTGLYD
ncbi:hypothetical protein BGZ47_000115 [Haplosporangium gracile]|nr:hypothetical protein BGZ47_000115 [Haplosporangium gracile]